MNEWTKLRMLHGLIAVVIASVGAILSGLAAFYGSALWFGHLYPHDGQDVLGAVFVGLLALPVAWVILFIAAFVWLGRLAKKQQIEEEREAAQPHYTITGNRV